MNGSTRRPSVEGRVLALCGGVGGAKLALGLQHILGERLTVVVNVGDDFEHLGLHISPDLDTVLYTLGGLNDHERGWGRAGETWNFMAAMKEVGGDTWFMLGDRDLALHVQRSRRLAGGQSLTAITADIAARFGIRPRVLPVTDDLIRTIVVTTDGELEFQQYFVKHRCEPVVEQIRFDGAEKVAMTKEVRASFDDADLRLVVICPSNPYLSVDPILAVPGIRDCLRAARVPIVAVSPIIGGQAVKGPTRKIMDELGRAATNAEIVRHYSGLIDGLIVDVADAAGAAGLDSEVCVAPTLMTDLASKTALAEQVLSFGKTLQEMKSARKADIAPGGPA